MIELNAYDREWLHADGLTHEEIAIVEDYLVRFQKKYPNNGECTACMAAYKRFKAEKAAAKAKAELRGKMDARIAEAKRRGMGSDFQQGVWAPFNGKTYYDRSKMVADAKAMGLEEAGNETDIRKYKNATKPSTGPSMRESLEQTLKIMNS